MRCPLDFINNAIHLPCKVPKEEAALEHGDGLGPLLVGEPEEERGVGVDLGDAVVQDQEPKKLVGRVRLPAHQAQFEDLMLGHDRLPQVLHPALQRSRPVWNVCSLPSACGCNPPAQSSPPGWGPVRPRPNEETVWILSSSDIVHVEAQRPSLSCAVGRQVGTRNLWFLSSHFLKPGRIVAPLAEEAVSNRARGCSPQCRRKLLAPVPKRQQGL